MNFWESKSGMPITGSKDLAYLKDFENIPNNTMALAKIESFKLHEEIRQFDGMEIKEYRIVWKLTDGEFKNREVIQKIKPFDANSASADRALNMMKLVMDLCKYVPTHSLAPTDQDLLLMKGQELGIKIGEWKMPKQDGSGFMTGNNVKEVHAKSGFECATGESLKEEKRSPPESALTRNKRGVDTSDLNDDIPF